MVASDTVAALEACWAEIQSKHPDVPDCFVVLGKGAYAKGLRLGSFHPHLWTTEGGSIPQVFVSGEVLRRGADAALQTLIHEAVHGAASTRGVKDTSRGGRWHNKRFLQIAEEFGLTAPEATHPSIGYSHVTAPPALLDTYTSRAPLAEAITAHIAEHPEPEKTKPAPKPAYECGCPRKMRMSDTVFAEGPVKCGICDEPFLEVL